ncbi:Lcl C-terminal domain-containing protein [Psychrobacter sp. I-STPA10]|uniref:Lcl C-terminal domain-containing protein n=1 Tax=Psychrobacter sp. I-STPA10 TaxID=2585769 RepID=UPI001E2C100E|nr:DUF1566 domain-containing protein [Psychrobacter sp. I-STPA10]
MKKTYISACIALSVLVTSNTFAVESSTQISDAMTLTLDDKKLTVDNHYLTYHLIRGVNSQTGKEGDYRLISPNEQWVSFKVDWDKIKWNGYFPDLENIEDFDITNRLSSKKTTIINIDTALYPPHTDWQNSKLRVHGGGLNDIFANTNSPQEKYDRVGLLFLNSLKFMSLTTEALTGRDNYTKASGAKLNKQFQQYKELAKLAKDSKKVLNDIQILLVISEAYIDEVEKYAAAVGVDPNTDPNFAPLYKNFKQTKTMYDEIAKSINYVANVSEEKKQLKQTIAVQYQKAMAKSGRKVVGNVFSAVEKEFAKDYKNAKTEQEKKKIFLTNIVGNLNKSIFKYKENYIKHTGSKEEQIRLRRNLAIGNGLLTVSYIFLVWDSDSFKKKLKEDPESVVQALMRISIGAVTSSLSVDDTEKAVKNWYQRMAEIDGRSTQMHRLRGILKEGKKAIIAVQITNTIMNKVLPFLWDIGFAPSALETKITDGKIKTYPNADVFMQVNSIDAQGKMQVLSYFMNQDKTIEVEPNTKIVMGVKIERPVIFSQFAPWKQNSLIFSSVLQKVTIIESGKSLTNFASTALCLRKIVPKPTGYADFSLHKAGIQSANQTTLPIVADGSNSLGNACNVGTVWGKPWYKETAYDYQIADQYLLNNKTSTPFTKYYFNIPAKVENARPIIVTSQGFDNDFQTYTIKFIPLKTNINKVYLSNPNPTPNEVFRITIEGIGLSNNAYRLTGCYQQKAIVKSDTKHIYECTAPDKEKSVKYSIETVTGKVLYQGAYQMEFSLGNYDLPKTIQTGELFKLKLKNTHANACFTGYNINWGDGNLQQTKTVSNSCLSVDALPTHVYSKAGRYDVKPVLISRDGRKLTTTQNLIVTKKQVTTSKLTATGITLCGNADKNMLECSLQALGKDWFGLGQDGEIQAGQSMEYEVLTRNGETCVKDKVTGLIWEQKTDDGGLRDKDNTYTWYNPDSSKNGGHAGTQNGGVCTGSGCDTQAYIQALNNANYCGYSDWRLPKREELRSIVDYGRYNPAVDTTVFPNTQSSYYWSSSPVVNFSGYAWDVYFYHGGAYGYDKGNNDYVRAVRSK